MHLRSYTFPAVLIASILLGGLTGRYFSQATPILKPLGEIFLNLLFTAIVPLVFFSVSSAIARTHSVTKLGKMFSCMTVVFIVTSIIAAFYALIIVLLFPPALHISIHTASAANIATPNLTKQLISIFTVNDFYLLFSHENMLALILFSMLVGFAATTTKEHGKLFASFLQAGEAVFMRVFALIMYMAPIGFFAYFAVLVSELGPKIIESYARVTLIYYVSSIIFFVTAFTGYAYLAGKTAGVKLFWKNVFLPMTTAIATCSSAASIPANLTAAKNMGIQAEVYETAIPLGSLIHKDGSVIGGIFKIAFLFGMLQLPFTTLPALLTALGVSLLVGTVMGAIPSGGMLGELLILSVYGFSPSLLMVIAAISIIIDPLATMLNVTGNTVSAMLISRYLRKPQG